MTTHHSHTFTGAIEFRDGFTPRPDIQHVVMDFDGTLSLIREGWPEVMIPMFLELLPGRSGETEEEARRLMTDDIMSLNGKQTIYQMIQFADRVRERGGVPREPLWYKHEYLRRLQIRIQDRLDGLASGKIHPDELVVHGGRALLEQLRRRGLTLCLASGTDEQYVIEESRLLKVDKFFAPHIYGARDDYKTFSKKMVIERILRENKIDGHHLLAIGDGYVEIENAKEAGGLAIAVASDEARNGSGLMDEWKRKRLMGVGADVVVADYRDATALLNTILGPETAAAIR